MASICLKLGFLDDIVRKGTVTLQKVLMRMRMRTGCREGKAVLVVVFTVCETGDFDRHLGRVS